MGFGTEGFYDICSVLKKAALSKILTHLHIYVHLKKKKHTDPYICGVKHENLDPSVDSSIASTGPLT